ncbi:MAG: hypothetical protein U5K74_16510 [Gemmatimonadaceae bacterium]|nr:hypothetical protein [Gemmatimonadaceae bacterium]
MHDPRRVCRVLSVYSAGGMRWTDDQALEMRARHDPEARAVLRAFLGVREILWEFGLRPRAEAPVEEVGVAASQRGPAAARAPRSARRTPTRLQRVPIEG